MEIVPKQADRMLKMPSYAILWRIVKDHFLVFALVFVLVALGLNSIYSPHVVPPSVEQARAELQLIIKRSETLLAFCVDPCQIAPHISAKQRELNIDNKCAEHILENGNSQNTQVVVGGQVAICSKNTDPSSKYGPKQIRGTEDLLNEIRDGKTHVGALEDEMESEAYRVKNIATAMVLNDLAHDFFGDLKENCASGVLPALCLSKEETEKRYMCAHVLLNQLPQAADCYKRSEVNPLLSVQIENFERGNPKIDVYVARNAVFNGCVKLFEKRFRHLEIDFEEQKKAKISDVQNERKYATMCKK